jgi:hypothetical protein
MLEFETHNIEPPLAELGEAASRYFHDRLIAPEKRTEIVITLRLISDDMSNDRNTTNGLQQGDMLAIKKQGKPAPPDHFDVLIRRQDDVLDTMLTLAHEWIHLAQVASGRFMLHGALPKPGKTEKYTAQWLGHKIGLLDQIPYTDRPWELEANEWQHKLVEEFVDRFAKDETL